MDLEYNRIISSEEIAPIPEPELGFLRGEILKLLYPNVIGIDQLKVNLGGSSDQSLKASSKAWGNDHDMQLRCLILVILFNFKLNYFLGKL